MPVLLASSLQSADWKQCHQKMNKIGYWPAVKWLITLVCKASLYIIWSTNSWDRFHRIFELKIWINWSKKYTFLSDDVVRWIRFDLRLWKSKIKKAISFAWITMKLISENTNLWKIFPLFQTKWYLSHSKQEWRVSLLSFDLGRKRKREISSHTSFAYQ